VQAALFENFSTLLAQKMNFRTFHDQWEQCRYSWKKMEAAEQTELDGDLRSMIHWKQQ